jgi:hypothetical protein
LGEGQTGALDPTATSAVHCGKCFDAGFRPF